MDSYSIEFAMINKTWAFEKLFTITDTEIFVEPASIRNGFLSSEKELFYDFFTTKYNNQTVIVECLDGENLETCGLYDFFESLCQHNLLTRDKILIKTLDPNYNKNFPHKLLPPGMFWDMIYGDEVVPALPEQPPESSKFVGITVGRFTPPRFRAARELDRAFGSDAFIVFNPVIEKCVKFFNRMGPAYDDDINWLQNRVFDRDEVTNYVNAVKTFQFLSQETQKGYRSIWDKFQIEVVCETDSLSDHFFTEKTGRALAAGKPFLLLSGRHTLKHLREMGFQTYGKVLDESYDDEFVPARRALQIVNSLKQLYNSPDRAQKIQELYRIARMNKKLWPKLKEFHRRRHGNNG